MQCGECAAPGRNDGDLWARGVVVVVEKVSARMTSAVGGATSFASTTVGVLAILLVSCLSACDHSGQRALAHGPRIVVQTPEINLGRLAARSTLSVDLVVTNGGDEVLQVQGIRSGCSCREARLTKHAIQPGQTARLPLSLSIPSPAQQLRYDLAIQSNDPVTPFARIAVTADVFEEIEATPHRLLFTGVSQNRAFQKKILIRNNTDKLLTFSPSSLIPGLSLIAQQPLGRDTLFTFQFRQQEHSSGQKRSHNPDHECDRDSRYQDSS